MAFWKPGTEKPRFVEDEEGGIVLMSNNLASSSSSRYAIYLSLSHSRTFSADDCVLMVEICSYGYANIEKQRQRLPVYKYRTEILYLVENHATTIIVGETGSGKTTQIPQVSSLFFVLCSSLTFWVKTHGFANFMVLRQIVKV